MTRMTRMTELKQKLRAIRNNPKLFDGTPSEQAALKDQIRSLKHCAGITIHRFDEKRWVAPYPR